MLSGCEAQKKLPLVEAAILGIGSGQAQKKLPPVEAVLLSGWVSVSPWPYLKVFSELSS
jgi:hypothetical protein